MVMAPAKDRILSATIDQSLVTMIMVLRNVQFCYNVTSPIHFALASPSSSDLCSLASYKRCFSEVRDN
jgi:hypothetical protein